MATKDTKKPFEPANADTVIRAVRAALERHGWGLSGSTVDADGSIVVSARAVPQDGAE